MNDLLKKKCVPCEDKKTKPIEKKEAKEYLDLLPGWELSKDSKKISKDFTFEDFIGSITFVDRIADLAETEGHHPDIHIHYNKVTMELYTHSINGLSQNDFILAAKIDAYR